MTDKMKIYVKNMVCERCCLVIENALKQLHLQYKTVALGEIDFSDYYREHLPIEKQTLLSEQLLALGFSLLDDKKSKLVDNIKRLCLLYIADIETPVKHVLSAYLSTTLQREYNYLSNLFTSVEGTTIEQYYIRLRVEKVKELLLYNEMSLSEIAFQLGYSSVAHLSGQFKKITGLTPSYFRSLKNQKLRTSIDNL